MCYVGIHATALHTTALLIDSQSQIKAIVDGPAFHLREFDEAKNYTVLHNLLTDLVVQASYPPLSDSNCRSICIVSPSVRTDWDRYNVIKILNMGGWARIPITIASDGPATLTAGTLTNVGIAITVGSGSTIYGINSDGNEWQVGGWSTIMGEDPGGLEIARMALNAVILGIDGRREPCEKLTQHIFSLLKINNIDELIATIDLFRRMEFRAKIADIVPAVVKAVEESEDLVAKKIFDKIAKRLFQGFQVVQHRLNWTNGGHLVVFEGGVIENSKYLYKRLKNLIDSSASIDVPIRYAYYRPVVGATLFALAQGPKLPPQAKIELLEREINEFIQSTEVPMKAHYQNLLLGPEFKAKKLLDLE